ncbi:uncharacterized protein Z519_10654 [Cladophialophora bantiana CBS 173.52]|uniref:Nucleoside phosphorylase domain-containing protein n=1 Tax=Cladophialophora bantiana (strain ATCC 10958 / CBS 173.52 / CDC B-1940 / NIH 8579) TaxID=1442370 RepID=A0A0D2H5N6_CLAB1|nr:uncharacterized protein Z519_10654 [Cladophialophora bantiana CBS 173.52]KIW88608.1 hypothetical protein Z519_10654 [Cladophialophora bantiana CBS 173.52]
MRQPRARIKDFTVGWICALPIELTAAREALDEEYERIDEAAQYTLGRIGKHNVAVACLPAGQLGTSAAAAVAVHMQKTFPALQYGFMVGIAGGVPSRSVDVRLGDVVISHPQGRYGGVVQYDFGKTGSGGKQLPNGYLNSPHPILLQAVANMRASMTAGRSKIRSYMTSLNQRNLFPRPGSDSENLFQASYDHVVGETCDRCLKERIVERAIRTGQDDVVIHFGTIASGNQVIKDGLTRDRVSAEHGGVLCFEMEAAGLMNIFPCLVVRGICDYADSHKNKSWQPFAAAAAAACAKDILSYVPTVFRNLDDESNPRPPIETNGAFKNSPEVSQTSESQSRADSQGSAPKNGLDPSSLYTKSSLTPEQLRSYHESLNFREIDARHATIQDAHSETCGWLLDRPEYRDWLELDKLPEHHGFFWINGHPGCGKSTIMKFALEATKWKVADTTVIKFFFHARGAELEKTVVGMYRSLLFQLLDEFTDLQEVFALRPPKFSDDRSSYVWDVEALQSLFGHAVKRLGHRSLMCFIDAVDECEEMQVRGMIAFFEHLGDLAALSGLKLRTCFSSRHYPHVTLAHSISLVLEDQEGHQDDIIKYVNSKLKVTRSKLFDEVKREICERSSGIFLWVVLVVHILRKDADDGRLHALKQRLKEIPDGLDQLFDDILTRDTQDVESLVLCLQWVLFAKRPLKPIELFYAVSAGVEPCSIAEIAPEDVDPESLRNFILRFSKGLVELTKGEVKTVQFIHESVRNYLLKTNSLGRLRANLALNFSGTSHERLKKCCQDYIDVIVPQDIDLETTFHSKSLAKLVDDGPRLASKAHPFLEYAVRSILFHADTAAEHGLEQESFVEEFSCRRWMVLSDLFVGDKTQRYGSSVSPLYIFVYEGALNLIGIEARRVPHIDIKGGYYGYPLNAAIARRNEQALNALLMTGRDDLPSNGTIQSDVLYVTTEERETALRTCLVSAVDRDQTLLHWAAEHDKVDIVKILLITQKMNVNSKNDLGQTPLSLAALRGHAGVVQLLLQASKADIQAKNDFGQTPLLLAASRGRGAVVELLLETGKIDVDSADSDGLTPLAWAARAGHETVVKLLLETGKVDTESKDLSGRTPISWGASRGNAAVVGLLLIFWTMDTISKGKTLDMTRLGLNCKDLRGRTPLHGAIQANAVEVVKFLVSIDEVDLEAPNVKNRTSLQIARSLDLVEVTKLLLEAQRDRAKRKASPSGMKVNAGGDYSVGTTVDNSADGFRRDLPPESL